MPKTKVLCIFTTLLGNKATAARLADTLDRLPDVEPTYVHVNAEDYSAVPAPWWARATNPWHAEFLARQKARSAMEQTYELLLVQGWELTVAFRDLARRLPAAVLLDSVPATVDEQQRRQGRNGWRRWLSHQVHHRQFALATKSFRFFLPMGSDCAEALERDYEVERGRCRITLAPLDLGRWKAPARDYRKPHKLLFVGNDFVRKGGDFLLKLYAEHLAADWTLTLVSNDQAIAARQLPKGVEWVGGRSLDQLIEDYRTHDVFILPTQQDYMPQVLSEALATGMPCLAADVGGIRDLVRDGQTGFLLPPGAPASAWAERLSALAANPSEIRRLSIGARQFAEERLGRDRFDSLVRQTVSFLSSTPKVPRADHEPEPQSVFNEPLSTQRS
jgi:glycosyltransferase involved in cell wall biosynthesis